MKITEVTQNAIAPETMPILFGHIDSGRSVKLIAALDKLNAALTAGTIFNVVFNDVKDNINYALSSASDALRNEISNTLGRETTSALYDADIDTMHLSLQKAPSQIKRIQAVQKTTDPTSPVGKALAAYLALNTEAMAMVTALASLKDKIVKGRQPNPNAKPQYTPGAAAQAVITKINTILTQQIESVIEEYRKHQEKLLNNLVRGVLAKVGKQEVVGEETLKLFSLFASFKTEYKPETREETLKRAHYGLPHPMYVTKAVMKPDWEAKVAHAAKTAADSVREHFVMKNTAKLGKIIELKGNFKDAESINASVRRGEVHADMRIAFTDGSKFIVRNKVVGKISPKGLYFTQYPTTFHDVVLPDGSAMKLPSEERMNKVFAVTK